MKYTVETFHVLTARHHHVVSTRSMRASRSGGMVMLRSMRPKRSVSRSPCERAPAPDPPAACAAGTAAAPLPPPPSPLLRHELPSAPCAAAARACSSTAATTRARNLHGCRGSALSQCKRGAGLHPLQSHQSSRNASIAGTRACALSCATARAGLPHPLPHPCACSSSSSITSGWSRSTCRFIWPSIRSTNCHRPAHCCCS